MSENNVVKFSNNEVKENRTKSFLSMKLGTKLIIAFLLVGIVPLAIVGILSLTTAQKSLSKQAFNQLDGVREIKKTQINAYFEGAKADMGGLVETVATLRREAFNKLKGIHAVKKTQITTYFDSRFKLLDDVQQNLRFTGGIGLFTNAFKLGLDSIEYKDLSNAREKGFSIFMDNFGFYDVFLIDADGNVVYTVTKESDLGTNLKEGPLKNSGLAKAFRNSQHQHTIQDFEWYEPSNEPAAFFATPLTDSSGSYIGCAAFQISLGDIDAIMHERSGLGKTGQTYLVGKDLRMRSDLFSDTENHSVKASFAGTIDKNGVDTLASRETANGNSGADVIKDYNGKPVLSVFSPLKMHGLEWSIIAEIDVSEAFSPVDEKGEEFFTKYTEKYGYYDLFLINPDGYCFYTAAKEDDYKTNLVTGKYSSSNLGKLTRKVLNSHEFAMADFAPYAPSNNEPASFIAQPVIHNGNTEIVVALQLPVNIINAIMNQREGLGETGETILVGSDKLMRSDAYLNPETHTVKASFANPDTGKFDTVSSREALSGETNSKVIAGYDGSKVLASYTPINIGDIRWALIAKISAIEAFASVNYLKWLIGLIGFICAGCITGVSILFARSISKPITYLVKIGKNIAAGDFTQQVEVKQNDEIGILGNTFNTMITELRNVISKIKVSSSTVASSSEQLTSVSTQMASGSEEISSQIGNVATATEQMSSNINTMASASEEMSVNANTVSSTSEELSRNMNTVASAIEEMSSSINEVANNAREASKVANDASKMSVTATKTMDTLGEAAKEIGNVTEVIKRIAEQTNLLALNATIEAASAGESGKGFAVVANEIKELANQSAQAAEDIANKIEGVQANTNDAVKVIADVSNIINSINTSVDVISNAVQQQTSAANDISSNVSQANSGVTNITSSIAEVASGTNDVAKNASEAAKGANDVSSNVNGVNSAAKESTSNAQQVSTTAGDLAKVSGELQQAVEKFRIEAA